MAGIFEGQMVSSIVATHNRVDPAQVHTFIQYTGLLLRNTAHGGFEACVALIVRISFEHA